MATEKPAILQETHFVVEEGWLYRILRGGSIQLNKLMFSAAILLLVWLAWAAIGDQVACQETVRLVGDGTEAVDEGTATECSVWLHPTTQFLGGATILSFLLSILFGLLGLTVGKSILESTPAEQEVGARRADGAEGSVDGAAGKADVATDEGRPKLPRDEEG